MILAMGVVSVVLWLVSSSSVFYAISGITGQLKVVDALSAVGLDFVLGSFGLISLIGGLAFGTIAMVTGTKNLGAMEVRRMNREGWGMTRSGKVLGRIGLILSVLMLATGPVWLLITFALLIFRSVGVMG